MKCFITLVHEVLTFLRCDSDTEITVDGRTAVRSKCFAARETCLPDTSPDCNIMRSGGFIQCEGLNIYCPVLSHKRCQETVEQCAAILCYLIT